MKKIILLLLITISISCGTPGRVCGGKSGQRCVDVAKKSTIQNLVESKRNS